MPRCYDHNIVRCTCNVHSFYALNHSIIYGSLVIYTILREEKKIVKWNLDLVSRFVCTCCILENDIIRI